MMEHSSLVEERHRIYRRFVSVIGSFSYFYLFPADPISRKFRRKFRIITPFSRSAEDDRFETVGRSRGQIPFRIIKIELQRT